MRRVLVSSASHILSDYLLTSEGTHCYNLFKNMDGYDYQFEALSPYIRISSPLRNVTFRQVGSLKVSPTSPVFYNYVLHSEFFFRSLVAARRLLREKKIDVIHHMLPAVFNYTFSPLMLLSKDLKKPFVFGPVSAHFYQRPVGERILLPLTSKLHRKTIEKCDRLIAATEQIKLLYARLIDRDRISVIPFGVDAEKFRPILEEKAGDECRILYAGSLYPLKGVRYLIDAVAEVRRDGLAANLVILGEGRQKEALLAQAKRLGVQKHVRFEGLVHNSEMPEQYNTCDIFCFPTLGEPFGKAIIEAMACGKPVIATTAGGPSEIVTDGVNGILVPPGDSKAMATKIARLANNEEERHRLGINARKTVMREYSWNVIAEKYHRVYSEVL